MNYFQIFYLYLKIGVSHLFMSEEIYFNFIYFNFEESGAQNFNFRGLSWIGAHLVTHSIVSQINQEIPKAMLLRSIQWLLCAYNSNKHLEIMITIEQEPLTPSSIDQAHPKGLFPLDREKIVHDAHNESAPKTHIEKRMIDQTQLELPDLAQLFPHLDLSSQTVIQIQLTLKPKITPMHFPILELHLATPVPLEQLIERENETKRKRLQKQQELKSQASLHKRRIHKPSTFSKRNQPIPATHYIRNSDERITLSKIKIYRIHYRFKHKFTLRFKEIELRVTENVGIEEFTKMLLARIVKGPDRFKKVVYVEKERDLVPLIRMDQLYLRHRNFVQVREEVEEPKVGEKPVLLRKRNRPQIGMRKLIEGVEFKEFELIEEGIMHFSGMQRCSLYKE